MITNIWAKLDLLQAELQTLLNPLNVQVIAGKPNEEIQDWVYLYFTLETNGEKIWDDSKWTIYKEWLFDFYLVYNDASTPDVVLYEKLNEISNLICFKTYDLNWFKISSISEWNQSWVLRNTKNNPLIIAQYNIIYKYLYLE